MSKYLYNIRESCRRNEERVSEFLFTHRELVRRCHSMGEMFHECVELRKKVFGLLSTIENDTVKKLAFDSLSKSFMEHSVIGAMIMESAMNPRWFLAQRLEKGYLAGKSLVFFLEGLALGNGVIQREVFSRRRQQTNHERCLSRQGKLRLALQGAAAFQVIADFVDEVVDDPGKKIYLADTEDLQLLFSALLDCFNVEDISNKAYVREETSEARAVNLYLRQLVNLTRDYLNKAYIWEGETQAKRDDLIGRANNYIATQIDAGLYARSLTARVGDSVIPIDNEENLLLRMKETVEGTRGVNTIDLFTGLYERKNMRVQLVHAWQASTLGIFARVGLMSNGGSWGEPERGAVMVASSFEAMHILLHTLKQKVWQKDQYGDGDKRDIPYLMFSTDEGGDDNWNRDGVIVAVSGSVEKHLWQLHGVAQFLIAGALWTNQVGLIVYARNHPELLEELHIGRITRKLVEASLAGSLYLKPHYKNL